MKKILLGLIVGIVLLASVLLINTLRFTSRQMQVAPAQPVSVDEQSIAEHLAEALRSQTVSYQDAGKTRGEKFVALHQYLEKTFPKTHATLARETVGDYSLLALHLEG